ncbi:hypothetical protein [Actinomadura luteofluorescens]|uniref:hypothetical protein n=1 Tax=Actinomadura luteofluorescens TaxID=46163 RepID=UPI003D906E0A
MKIFSKRRREQEARETARRQRYQRRQAMQRATTIQGLRAAADWLEARPDLKVEPGVVPTRMTAVSVPAASVEAVREFAEQQDLPVEDALGHVTCRVPFGPVVIEIDAWASDALEQIIASLGETTR